MDTAFQNEDANCIHQATRTPDRRKCIYKLLGTEKRRFLPWERWSCSLVTHRDKNWGGWVCCQQEGGWGWNSNPVPAPRLEMTESILYALFILSNFKNICSVFMIDLSNISFYWLFFIIVSLMFSLWNRFLLKLSPHLLSVDHLFLLLYTIKYLYLFAKPYLFKGFFSDSLPLIVSTYAWHLIHRILKTLPKPVRICKWIQYIFRI